MIQETMKLLSVVLVLLALAEVCKSSPSDDGTTSDVDAYTGQAFLQLAKTLNSPLFSPIWKAVIKLECQIDACPWSAWSACRPVVGRVGVKTRTRDCSAAGSLCQASSTAQSQTDSGLCENIIKKTEPCPSDFLLTTDGFCLKFHNETKVGKSSAESTCKSEGAFLVNINSQRKWDAVEKYIKENKYSYHMWIDGEKQNNGSPWKYSYQTEQTGFTNWLSGEPSNGSNELCKAVYYRSSKFYLIDAVCSNDYHFACEKILK